LRLKRPTCWEHRGKHFLFGRGKRRTEWDLKSPAERLRRQRGDLFSTSHRYTTIEMASELERQNLIDEIKNIMIYGLEIED